MTRPEKIGHTQSCGWICKNQACGHTSHFFKLALFITFIMSHNYALFSYAWSQKLYIYHFHTGIALGLHQICQHNIKHNRPEYYAVPWHNASIMCKCFRILSLIHLNRSILSNKAVCELFKLQKALKCIAHSSLDQHSPIEHLLF